MQIMNNYFTRKDIKFVLVMEMEHQNKISSKVVLVSISAKHICLEQVQYCSKHWWLGHIC